MPLSLFCLFSCWFEGDGSSKHYDAADHKALDMIAEVHSQGKALSTPWLFRSLCMYVCTYVCIHVCMYRCVPVFNVCIDMYSMCLLYVCMCVCTWQWFVFVVMRPTHVLCWHIRCIDQHHLVRDYYLLPLKLDDPTAVVLLSLRHTHTPTAPTWQA